MAAVAVAVAVAVVPVGGKFGDVLVVAGSTGTSGSSRSCSVIAAWISSTIPSFTIRSLFVHVRNSPLRSSHIKTK